MWESFPKAGLKQKFKLK